MVDGDGKLKFYSPPMLIPPFQKNHYPPSMTQADDSLLLTCSSCKRKLPRGWFQRAGAGRRNSWCRICRQGAQSAHSAKRRKAGVKRVSPNLIRRLLNQQYHICPLCKRWLSYGPDGGQAMHIDHIVPIAKGGTHEESNLQITHARCNMKKAANL
jgi:5-methylcytosine-specific restriction endonuclease McrA